MVLHLEDNLDEASKCKYSLMLRGVGGAGCGPEPETIYKDMTCRTGHYLVCYSWEENI